MEDPEHFQVQPGALEVTVKGIHEAVTKIADCISHILRLVHQASSIGHGLMLLDTHVLELDSDNKNSDLPDIEAWQPCLRELRTQTAAARHLWKARIDGVEGRAQIEFARTTKGQATCAELSRGTYHEVFIAIGRLVIDTDDAGAVQQNEMGMASPHGSNYPKTVRGAIRLRVAEALQSRNWWQQAQRELDREYGDVLSQIGQAINQRRRPRATSPTKNGRTRPKSDAIDEVAKNCLMTALAASDDAGEHYIPSRQDIAKAVSKQLGHKIGVQSIFATKEEQGNRVPRYPKFMQLWELTRKRIKDAKESRAKRSREA